MAKQQVIMGPREIQLEISFPVSGLEEFGPFSKQGKLTTPSAQNVRSFDPGTERARGGQRPGLSKFIASQVNGNFPIQLLDHMVGDFPPVTGVGTACFGRKTSAGAGCASLVDGAGSIIASIGVAGEEYQGSIWTEDGTCILASRDGPTIKLLCVDAIGATIWTNSSAIGGSSSGIDVGGLGIQEKILYVLTDENKIYRFSTETGVAQDLGAWFTTTLGTPPENRRGCLSIAQGELCVVGGGATGKKLQIIDIGSATEIFSSSDSYANAQVITDGSNFYVAGKLVDSTALIARGGAVGEAAIGANPTVLFGRLWKLSPTGDDVWRVPYGDNVNGSIAYDHVGNALYMVDGGVDGKVFNPATGAITTIFSPNSTGYVNVVIDGAGGLILTDSLSVAGTVRFVDVQSDFVTENYDFTSTALIGLAPSCNNGTIRLGQRFYARLLRMIAIAGGTVKNIQGQPYSVTNGTLAFSPGIPVIFGTSAGTPDGTAYFFADGVSAKYYTPASNSVLPWVATAGSLPLGDHGERASLIALWRNRVVLVFRNDHNWYMSAVGDPFNWDFSPADMVETQAVAGHASEAGLMGDIITCLIPYSDDTMIFGGDHTIWQLTGDPMAGGRFDLMSDRIGIAWGRPFAKDPYGQVYFLGSLGSIYKLRPGSPPVKISQQIERRLALIDLANTVVRMAWDDRQKGLYVFLTPLATGATMHYFWDSRLSAWWPDVLGSSSFDPMVVHGFDGDDPDDRVILLGSRDGYIRNIDFAAKNDDGAAISSFVLLGPITSRELDDILLHDLQAVLGVDSDAVKYSVIVADSAEKALTATPAASGLWRGGRNLTSLIRRSGHAVYLKIENSHPNRSWALESIRARLQGQGSIRQRG